MNLEPDIDRELKAQAKFAAVYNQLSDTVPELKSRTEVMEAGTELIAELGLHDSLFESGERALVFTGLAYRWSQVASDKGKDALREKEFVANVLTLLAHEHSEMLGELSGSVKKSEGFHEEQNTKRVYEKYTDTELSATVTEKIRNGFLDDIKKKLGIDETNEDPFEVRVLTLSDDTQLHGLDAPAVDYDLPSNDKEFLASEGTVKDIKSWKQGLKNRLLDFNKELGLERDTIPAAWVTELDGVRTLCITSPLGEKIRDASVIDNTRWYTEDNLKRDYAILEHEYTHTQGGAMVDREVYFGINIEERRAEFYSGDNNGYQDVKGFFSDYAILTGQSITDLFIKYEKGGTAEQIYTDIANKVGLSAMIEVIMAPPRNYLSDQGNEFIQEVDEYIGGYDGVLGRIMSAEMNKSEKESIHERIDAAARKIVDISITSDNLNVIDLFENIRSKNGLHIVSSKIAHRAREMTS